MEVFITHIDTACILLEINDFRILTDPVFDQPGRYYHHGFGAISKKTDIPAIGSIDLSQIDLVLLSHHQHKDNLDDSGGKFIGQMPNAISTRSAAKQYKHIKGLHPWESIAFANGKIPSLRITATPAQHHPSWLPEFVSGKVIGFFIESDEMKEGGIYISGDSIFYDGIKDVGSRFRIHTGIFHLGGVQFRYLTGLGQYTMNSRDLIKALKYMNPGQIVPVHQRGWTHFHESEDQMKATLLAEETVRSRLLLLNRGTRTRLM